MRQLKSVLIVALASVLGVVSAAEAQMSDEPRYFISIDGGYQGGGDQLFEQRSVSGPVFGEDQIQDVDQSIDRSGGLFRANASAKIWEDIGAGFGFTRSTGSGMANVTVAVPHPIFLARPRVASTDLTALGHRSSMYHFQVVYMRQLDEQIHVQVFGGPTVMSVDQAFVGDAIAVEVGAPFSSVNIADVQVTELSENGVGFNVGIDLSYMIGTNYGLGGFVQYAGGSTDFVIGGNTISVDVGGIQVGGGVRFQF